MMYGNGYGYGMNYMPQYTGAINDVLAQYKGPYQNQFPAQTPMQQMPQPQPQTPQASTLSDRIWIQGLAGAKSYLVAPNTTVVLWDTESPTIYIKSADSTGKPLDMRILDFKERGTPEEKAEHKCTCGNDFKKMTQEIDSLKEKQTYLENLINSLIPKEEN